MLNIILLMVFEALELDSATFNFAKLLIHGE